jgi:hypothetical protein
VPGIPGRGSKPPGPIVVSYQIDRIKRSPADAEQE